MNISMNKKDEIIMHLVHYFITEENYQPIIVNGVKNEIWLENLDANYKVIRINSNYIHNIDQLKFDNYKIKNITKQIRKKTFSLNLKTLNILLDLNDDVIVANNKYIDNYKIDNIKDIRKDDGLGGIFPKLKTMSLSDGDSFETLVNLTTDISKKNAKDNAEYEKIFAPKKITLTYILIAINIFMFILEVMYPKEIIGGLLLSPVDVKSGEIYRLFTSMFLHGDIIHLVMNMYALFVIGKEIENSLGKYKFIIIYLTSGIAGSLLSCIGDANSLGASGAIFGLFGALLYFGYHYRLYFGQVILREVIPVILINLLIGFMVVEINNAAHIGGLVGGIFTTMALGVSENKKQGNRPAGIVCLSSFVLVLIYLVFIAK